MKTTRLVLVASLSILALVAMGCDSGDGAESSGDGGSQAAGTNPDGTDPGTSTPTGDGTDEPDPADPPVVDPVDDPVVDPVVLPELPDGPTDGYATSGCANLDAEPEVIVAGASESEAGQTLLLPGADSAFLVQLPTSGVGYVTVEVPDWQVIVAVFAHHTTGVAILDPLEKTEVITPLSWNAACTGEGVTDQRTKYHKWGGFTFELTGEPDEEVWLSLIDYELE